MIKGKYRGRIAPSPTGYLHIGHAMTFKRAQERARAAGGKLILRIEDLDASRCRPEFADAIIGDLKWFGLEWDEGPDVGGAFAPYVQSARRGFYLDAWEKLRAGGFIYPCRCSRKDVLEAGLAPHDENEEPIYPGTCRPQNMAGAGCDSIETAPTPEEIGLPSTAPPPPNGLNWRFRVPDGEEMEFVDRCVGRQRATAGKHFGDFVVWRRDNLPAYQLAVVVDDSSMKMTEVVRGADLLLSTFRQLMIYRALNLSPPGFYHAPLVLDENGRRLAKRHAALSLRELRVSGARPEQIRRRHVL
jgi:glutamyl/glutaminyl-tRNA synthetase